MLRRPQKLFEPRGIETHHRFPVNEGDGGGSESQLDQLFEGLLVRPDILRHELDPLLRKKLFLPITRPSPGLRVHNNLLCHGLLHVSEESRWLSS